MSHLSTSAAGRSTRTRIVLTRWLEIFAEPWRQARSEFLGRKMPLCLSQKWYAILPKDISKCPSIPLRKSFGANAVTWNSDFLKFIPCFLRSFRPCRGDRPVALQSAHRDPANSRQTWIRSSRESRPLCTMFLFEFLDWFQLTRPSFTVALSFASGSDRPLRPIEKER